LPCLDGEQTADGRPIGRVVAESTFHHFVDLNWDVDLGAPSFVTDPPGDEMKRDPSRLNIFKRYVRNIVRWLDDGKQSATNATRLRSRAVAEGKVRPDVSRPSRL
jgi:hypothetical protein